MPGHAKAEGEREREREHQLVEQVKFAKKGMATAALSSCVSFLPAPLVNGTKQSIPKGKLAPSLPSNFKQRKNKQKFSKGVN
jgi:hypothetical protein